MRRIIPAHAGQTACADSPLRAESDHPRACGANVRDTMYGTTQFGSSPRMRGKRSVPSLVSERCRIIPAHAGQTWSRMLQVAVRPDHPRACGANRRNVPNLDVATGSSPRMRGKRLATTSALTSGRIIPAHAGQTSRYHLSPHLGTDHPRACGANNVKSRQLARGFGSSPRMRGKLDRFRRVIVVFRIIPAHAGQT